MPIRGSFEEMSPSDVVQLMHASGKTGTLYLFGSDGAANLVFVSGAIVSASHPAKTRLGTLLVERGLVHEGQIEEAMARQRQSAARRLPLSVTLVELGHLTREDARQAIQELATMTLVEVVGWKTGTFVFDAGELEGEDGFHYGEVALRLQGKLHTEELLVEAMRRLDERRRHGPDPTTADTGSHAQLADAPPGRDPQAQMRMLRQAVYSVERTATPQEIAPLVLELGATMLQRGILFEVSRGSLSSLGSFGIPESTDGAPLAAFELPWSGASDRDPGGTRLPHEELHRLIGAPRADGVVWLPIEAGARTALMFYGDMGDARSAPRDLEALEILVAFIEEVLSARTADRGARALFSEVAV